MNSPGAEFESNSERLRSYSGAKDMSAFAAASCCCRNKRSIVKVGGWNCPHCRMVSPRHWNVSRHILRVHDGLGEPTNEFGKTRKEQHRTNTNLEFGYGNYYHDSQKSPSFLPVKFKESRVGGGSTLKDGLPNNNNKSLWDFMDDFIEPVKKVLEFKRALDELAPSSQYYSYHYYSPYAISHQYPQSRLHLSSPINFSSAGSMAVGQRESTHNSIGEDENNMDFDVGDLEIIIGYQGYFCKDCLIFHPLALYLDRQGKIAQIRHKCNSQRLHDIQHILDKKKEVSELISQIPGKMKSVVNEWTRNQNCIYAVEVKKEELASDHLDLVTDLAVTDNQSWIARAIRDKQTTLTDEEIEDFLGRCGYSTFSYFNIHLSDNNDVPPVCYTIGIVSPKIKYVADKLRSDNGDNYQELSMSNQMIDNGITGAEDPKTDT